MKVRAQAKYVRHSPYKVRRVLDLVRGLPVQEAEDMLRLTSRGATEPISSVAMPPILSARKPEPIRLMMPKPSISDSISAPRATP